MLCIYLLIYLFLPWAETKQSSFGRDPPQLTQGQVAILKLLHTRPAKTARTWVRPPTKAHREPWANLSNIRFKGIYW